ncbi:MerR family DNA-binding transcriptional regulator [Enterococcus faecium]|nr:MerR family DNA-binding transcriptional regulator [Enterococcus faecium]NVE05742.1 MerR family DNA-binding transcriptional regulator [Enterococcus faecium]NVE09083.1 MerR family DNA-binding transcriptional regulator [Enterococcus faecium]NVF18469.1 MerR family DNA-binding transcriptional regulator [Enterococcus faecium]NVF25179.1 MerR family DNA-binding transcriptional regulator [Enterococcus faecium]
MTFSLRKGLCLHLSGGKIMEYTIKKMSEISGVSPRTLRFYDEIGLLKPARINSSGYRIYGKKKSIVCNISYFIERWHSSWRIFKKS